MKDKIKINFSKGAKDYDKYAIVQKSLAKELINSLGEEEYFNILEVGCGTGFLTKLLREKYPRSHITALDISESMINKTKEHFNEDLKINFIVEDVEKFQLKEAYDLIISSATFQWIEDLEGLIVKLYEAIEPKGSINFTIFIKGTFKELDFSINKAMEINNISRPWKRNYLAYEEIKDMMGKATNIKVSSKHRTYEEWFENSLDFLKTIKAMGTNSSEVSEIMNPKIMKDIIKIYDENYNFNFKIKVTYESAMVKVYKI